MWWVAESYFPAVFAKQFFLQTNVSAFSCSVSSDVSLAGLCASSDDEESGGFDELPADLPLHASSSMAAMPPANPSDRASSGPEIALACKMDDLPTDLPFHPGAICFLLKTAVS